MLRTVSACCLLTLLLAGNCLLAEDWNQWRGAERDGVSRGGPRLLEALPDDGLKPVWTAVDSLPGASSGGWSSPIVAGGRVYLFTHARTKVGSGELPPAKFPYLPPEQRGGMSDQEYEQYERNRRDEQEARSKSFRFDERVYCLDAATGQVLWKQESPSVYTRFSQSGTPAVVAGRLLVLGAGRVARCLDAATGQLLWERPLPGPFRDQFLQSSFAVAGQTAVVLCGSLFGLDVQTGEIRWSVGEATEEAHHGSPVVWRHQDRDYVIVNLDSRQTVCVEAESGRQVWSVDAEAGHSTPVIAGQYLLTYGNSRKKGLKCYELSLAEPQHLWTFQGLSDPGSSPVVVDQHVYVQGERKLSCVDLASGAARWTTTLDLDRPRYTSLVAADGKVIYAFGGIVGFAANPQQFRPWLNARIDKQGLLGEESLFRRQLDLDKLEQTSEGRKDAERLWRERIGSGGPLACASPALVHGRLYVRLGNGLACYDLSAR
ncbi:MAG: PQQ-binding-like beta-propeller repeat protein [Pirellulaceae bacterium]|nr:PQQ-binding-like beta-propeller repeat protein [Pirellulaceae bacterium]